MSPDSSQLLALAEAVADGRAVDWAAESGSLPAADRALVDQLRLLAGVGEVHRTTATTGEVVSIECDELPMKTWGSLELREKIGSGQFGTVYRAWDPHLEREVALKLLDRRSSPRAGAASSDVVHEGRLLARVRHPHVVTVFGADEIHGRVGVWMDLVQGSTLEAVLRGHGTFSAREAALIGVDLCGALAAVHHEGLVHRDVKAQNVIREAGGRILLMDFGAGEEVASRGDEGRITGTPLYMAPELFEGEAATPQSDIYSVGVLLFWLTTGTYPVLGRTAAEVRTANLRRDRRRLRDARPDLPPGFVDVVELALAHNPTDRYQTAGAFEDALRDFVSERRRWDSVQIPITKQRRIRQAFSLGIALIAVAVLLAATMWGQQVRRWIWPTPVKTIAVLPFQNVGGEPGQEYVVSGLNDLLVTRLLGIPDLRIIPPSSTAGLSPDPKRRAVAARDMGAQHFLEGSVERSGDRIRISVRLIAASTGTLIWGDTLERQISDMFTVQGEIAAAIARLVRGNMSTAGASQMANVYTTSVKAQEAYLRGRYLLYRFELHSLPEMLRQFERAVALDPQFALAQASLSRAYLMAHAYGLASAGEIGPRTLTAGRTAVALAPGLSDAHVALAEALFKIERDWDAADVAFRKAIELSPHASVVRSPYSRFLSAAGRPEDALEHAVIGALADPASAEMLASVAITRYYLRQFVAAVADFDRVIALNPQYSPGYFGRARARTELGQFAAAIADIKRALELSGGEASYQAELARVNAVAGWRNTAEQLLGGLLERSTSVAPQDLAHVYAALGDSDRAFDLLTKALHENHTRVLFLRVDPRVDMLRGDTRFQHLLAALESKP